MNKEISIERIFVYYDIPQVFVAKDAVGVRYLCLYIDSSDTYDAYVGVQISSDRMYELFAGKVDLREAYVHPEIVEYCVIHHTNDLRVVDITTSIDEQYLPEEGFFVTVDLDDTIDGEMMRLNKPLLHVGLVDDCSAPRADVKVLSRVLGELDGLYSSTCARLGVPTKDRGLVAFIASAASYNIHMYADVEPDLFGKTKVDDVFAQMDLLFHHASDENLNPLTIVEGTELSHFKSLIRILNKNGLSMKYKYLSTQIDAPLVSHHIESRRINALAERIALIELPDVERVVLDGYFARVDATRTGLWTFVVEDEIGEIETITGKVMDIDILTGVVMKSVRYRITCEKKISRGEGREQDKNNYTLMELRRL